MPKELQKLIDAAKNRDFPASEREAQRRSFAYGNTEDRKSSDLEADGGSTS